MDKIDLKHTASGLKAAWLSMPVGRAAGANIEVVRMDASRYPNEVHEFVEALLVLEGQLNLEIEVETVCVGAGEVAMVPAGQAHAVAP
jgi:quercetin dioxygenase-like cupin family protein